MRKTYLFSLIFVVIVVLVLASSLRFALCDDSDSLSLFESVGADITSYYRIAPPEVSSRWIELSSESSRSPLKSFILYLERQEKSPPL